MTTLPWLYSVSAKETRSIIVDKETVVVHRILATITSDVIGFMPEMTSDSVVVQGRMLDGDLLRMAENELREIRRRRETTRDVL
jgi:hypothetical protein